MSTLKENLRNRVKKLAKPANQAQALQPFFEAVSNSLMAIDDRREYEGDRSVGSILINIDGLAGENVQVKVKDTGIGLDDERFSAFCTIDTNYKETRGGKGVGRLYWLDAFSTIEVESRYRAAEGIQTRAFEFKLAEQEQLIDIDAIEEWAEGEIGTVVRFRGLRAGPYAQNFSKQPATLQNYFAAEFIADFLSGGSAPINLIAKTEKGAGININYPADISELVVVGPQDLSQVVVESLGSFSVVGYLCDGKTSRGLDGRHQVHLLGNGRTVQTRKVDDLIGISAISAEGRDNLALHLVVSSEFLDERTSESRTSFSIPEAELSNIVKAAVAEARSTFIAEQVSAFDAERRKSFEKQPIFGYGQAQDIFDRLPVGATSPEAFASALAVPRMRAEQKREERLQSLVKAVVSGDKVPVDFAKTVREAADGIHENERNSLAHHAARRRVVLDLLDALIRRVRERHEKEDLYHLEKTLHSLLVPMRVVGTDGGRAEPSAHDLWILDERLAFTSAFASDLPLKDFLEESDDEGRPDIVLWDTLFGLGAVGDQSGETPVDDIEQQSKIFIVELKHPGRTNYGPGENVEDQVKRYVKAIKGRTIEGFGRRPIKVTKDCQFHCTIVADFRGGFADQIEGWDYIYNQRARQRRLGGDFDGVVIQALEWDYVLATARENNRALLDAAGMQRHGLTSFSDADGVVEIDLPEEVSEDA